jgi:hypothetical protein
MNRSSLTKFGAPASARFNLGTRFGFHFAAGHRMLKRRGRRYQIPVKFFEPTIASVKVSVANQPPKS